MMLGLALSVCSTGRVASSYDPSTASLTGWVQAEGTTGYVPGTWLGVASAGASGSRNATEAAPANQPPTGTAINTHVPPDFDGTTLYSLDFGSPASLLSTTAYTYSIALIVDTSASGAGNPYDYQTVFSDSGGAVGLAVRTLTGDPTIIAFHYDGVSYKTVSLGAANGWSLAAMHSVQVEFNGSTLRARVDGNSYQSTAAGSLSSAANPVRFGRNYNGAVGGRLDGRIYEAAFGDSVLGDAFLNGHRSYLATRYSI